MGGKTRRSKRPNFRGSISSVDDAAPSHSFQHDMTQIDRFWRRRCPVVDESPTASLKCSNWLKTDRV